MGIIDREDMLELTRRMTLKRNCFGRIAGVYIDEEGYIDGTFNIHFQNLSPGERSGKLSIAKAIPFGETNKNLTEYSFDKSEEAAGSVWQLLMGIRNSELKNDALLEIFYELMAEKYQGHGKQYGVYFFYGGYDVPLKGTDKVQQGESEEVYRFVVCAVCPVHGDYEAGEPECGFLFPAFKGRSTDIHRINIFQADAENPHRELLEIIRSQCSIN